jgi:DNA-binding transcriptional MerR regulator
MARNIHLYGGKLMTSEPKITYSTGETAELTDATIKQIYYWEKRGFLNPDKVVCGKIAYKRYTPCQVDIVKEIKG